MTHEKGTRGWSLKAWQKQVLIPIIGQALWASLQCTKLAESLHHICPDCHHFVACGQYPLEGHSYTSMGVRKLCLCLDSTDLIIGYLFWRFRNITNNKAMFDECRSSRSSALACKNESFCCKITNIPLQKSTECVSLQESLEVTEWEAAAFGTHCHFACTPSWCLMGNTDCQLWLKLTANHRQGQISKIKKVYSRKSGFSVYTSWAHAVLCVLEISVKIYSKLERKSC